MIYDFIIYALPVALVCYWLERDPFACDEDEV